MGDFLRDLLWKQNLFLPEPLIQILEQITMPHLSANRDDIYVTSIKHAHSATACGTHGLEEFRHWGKAGRADSSRQQQLQEQRLMPQTKTYANHANPVEREFFY